MGLGEKIMRNICLRGKQLPPHPQFQYPERMLPWARLLHTCCFPAPPHQTYKHPQQASSKEERKSLLKTSLLPSPENHARHSRTLLCFLEEDLDHPESPICDMFRPPIPKTQSRSVSSNRGTIWGSITAPPEGEAATFERYKWP